MADGRHSLPRRFPALVALVCLAPGALPAQPERAASVGERVRISAPVIDSLPLRGTLIRSAADTLAIRLGHGGATVLVPTPHVAAVDASRGRDRWNGALFGAPIGAIAVPEQWERRFTTMVPSSGSHRPTHAVDLGTGGRVCFTVAGRTRSATIAIDSRDTLHVPGAAIRLRELEQLHVRGEKDRRRGALYGALIATTITALGAVPDHRQGEIGTADMLGAFAFNALLGAGVGAWLAPAGWVRVPLPR